MVEAGNYMKLFVMSTVSVTLRVALRSSKELNVTQQACSRVKASC